MMMKSWKKKRIQKKITEQNPFLSQTITAVITIEAIFTEVRRSCMKPLPAATRVWQVLTRRQREREVSVSASFMWSAAAAWRHCWDDRPATRQQYNNDGNEETESTETGARGLKTQDRKVADQVSRLESARLENVWPENEGPDVTIGKCRTGIERTSSHRVEIKDRANSHFAVCNAVSELTSCCNTTCCELDRDRTERASVCL